MSTKIYTAYRLPTKHLNKFLIETNEVMFNNVVKRLNLLMDKLKPEGYYQLLLKQWKDKAWVDKIFEREGKAARFGRLDAILSACKEAAQSPRRDIMFDIECGWFIRISNKYAYVIPYGEAYTHDNLKLQDYVEDYSYWNNTDRPENISPARWGARAKKWNDFFDRPHENPVLKHSVVDVVNDNIRFQIRVEDKLKLGWGDPEVWKKKHKK